MIAGGIWGYFILSYYMVHTQKSFYSLKREYIILDSKNNSAWENISVLKHLISMHMTLDLIPVLQKTLQEMEIQFH